MLPGMTTRIIAALAAALLLLAGCGEDTDEPDADDTPTVAESSSDSTTEAAPTGPPACAEVWVPGQTLPADFAGCTEGGATVSDVGVECADGATTLYVYENPTTGEDQYFGITGQEIGNADDDADDDGADDAPYAKAYSTCTGG